MADIVAACQANYSAHVTDCSGFCRAVAAAVSVPLQGLANDIVATIRGGNGWVVCDGPTASTQAGLGNLVIGGLLGSEQATPNQHGHVVVVVPGTLNKGLYPFAYWGSLGGVPSGPSGNTINYAWNVSDRDKVTYAAYTTATLPPGQLPPPANKAPAPPLQPNPQQTYPVHNGVMPTYPNPTPLQSTYSVPPNLVVRERDSAGPGAGQGVGHVGDYLTHGAVIITGAATVGSNERPVARLGDLVNCPIQGHGINPFQSGCSSSVFREGRPVTISGATTACGAVLIVGSPNVSSSAG